jgi:hypothetical protein
MSRAVAIAFMGRNDKNQDRLNPTLHDVYQSSNCRHGLKLMSSYVDDVRRAFHLTILRLSFHL